MAYLFYLAALLDRKDKDWRKETVLLLDNASYHKSDKTMAAMQKLGINVIFSGPYSFDR